MDFPRATAARRRRTENDEINAKDTEMKNLFPEGKDEVIPSAPPREEVPDDVGYPELERVENFEFVDVPECTHEELLDSMPVVTLKRLMDRYAVSYEGCIEKKELVSRAAPDIDLAQLSAFLDDPHPPGPPPQAAASSWWPWRLFGSASPPREQKDVPAPSEPARREQNAQAEGKERKREVDECCAAKYEVDEESVESNPAEECPICMEDITEAEAVGRCRGDHGQQHLFHATCLSQWVARSANDRQMHVHGARCPVCRGSVEVHEGRLRSHLQQAEEKDYEGKAVDPAANAIFQDMLGDGQTTDGGWRKLVTRQNIVTAIKVAGVAITLGHGFRAGWNLDVPRLFTTYEILTTAAGTEAALTGERETMTGVLRVLHVGAGVVGIGVRIGHFIMGYYEDQRKRKADKDDDDDDSGDNGR
mmetsp:Transcript_5467/g.9896  ORF Transcript_5467/g.9896 Transcript_5467/m.9896 type:complete len:419 (-) Transcript_5467:241-1497(-)